MEIKFKKPVGWILLFVGISIIFWSLYSSYNIFTGKSPLPEIFKPEEEKIIIQTKKETKDLEAQMEKILGEQLKGLFPSDYLPKILNLTSWSILAGILVFGGAQISGIGIKLLKD